MGHHRLAALDAEQDEPRRTPPADDRDPRLAMAQALGNARFTALMRTPRRNGARQLARTLDEKLPTVLTGLNQTYTVGQMRAFKATIERGWAAMGSDQIQVSFVDAAKVSRYIAAANTSFTALEGAARGVNANDPDAASVTKDEAANKQGALGPHAHGVVGNLVLAARAINAGFDEWKANQVEPDWKSFERDKKDKREKAEQEEKQKGWAAQAEREKNASKAEEAEEKVIEFPHGGKHQPPPGLASRPDNIRDQMLNQLTGKPKAEALYLTHVAATVVGWETEAMTNGITLRGQTGGGDFTILYAFDHEIGSDGGEMTRFIRCEGFHHGHPIRREGETSFNDYVRKEIQGANGDQGRLQALRAFLLKVKVRPQEFGL